MVPQVPKVKRETDRSNRRRSDVSKAFSFASVLDRAIADHRPADRTADEPGDCYIVTYNANRELQAYFYRPSVEYTL